MKGADAFFDTNVVLYLLSADVAKAARAEQLLAEGGTLSVQVLNEIANAARRKLALTWPEVREVSDLLRAACPVEPLTVQTHERALQIAARLGISAYDAMIIASALTAGCTTLYSEDLQHGQVVDGKLTIRNPFIGA